MRILHVAAPARVGGLEAVLHSLAAGQRAAGHDVRVAAVLDVAERDGHPVVGALGEAGVPVTRLALPRRAYLKERAAIRALCGEVRPDVVHSHGYRADVVDAGVARRLGIPVVATVHGFTGGGWKNRLYEWLDRRALRRLETVVAVSRGLADTLAAAGVPQDRIHVIPNAWDHRTTILVAVDARRELGLPADGRRIGWVGRLSGEKGPDVMVAAIDLLRDQCCALSMLGDGRERPALERQSIRLGVAERVTWHGAVSVAGRLFRAFDVFVLSSRTEGIPLALLEAMAAQVPVVATAVGGVPDVVSAAEALLVPPNDPAALAAAIREVLRNPNDATMRARAARTRLDGEFALGPWLERYEALYRGLRCGTSSA